MIVAKTSDCITDCMRKMLSRDIRHLPLEDDDGEIIGMLSIKDLVKEFAREKDEVIHKLHDFNMGKGAFFEHT